MKNPYCLTIALLVCLATLTDLAPSAAAAPSATNVLVQSGAASAPEDVDLSCTYDLTDAVATATAWYRNGSPTAAMLLPMEGGAVNGLLDFSGNGRPIAAVGTPATAWQATGGRLGTGAYAFGSGFHINAGEVFPVSGSYTKMAWVKRTGSGSNNIMSSQDVTGGHVFYASQSQSFRLGAGQVGLWNLVQDPDSLYTNIWYHVAVTFDYSSGLMVLYKDGAMVDSATVPTDRRDILDATLLVGAFANSSQWIGVMDDARLYSYALTPEQVQVFYTSYDSVASAETSIDDVWYADVTPFSATEIGSTVQSNSVTVVTGVPVVSGIPDQSVPEDSTFDPIILDNYVTDPNDAPSEMTWTSSGAVNLSVSIVSRVATISILDTEWNGSDTIVFRATDPTALHDEDTAIFTVTPVNDPPIVLDIPNQLVMQGETFSIIVLDDYVVDIDHYTSDMTWTSSGEVDLIVTIDNLNGTATIDLPYPEWYGSETITFRATDPGGLYAEDAATFTVDADPGVQSVMLSAASPNPLTGDDLICSWDLTGNATSAATAWQRNGSPDMVLYLPTAGGPAAALLDYSGHGFTVTPNSDPAYDSTGGHDGLGSIVLDGNDHLNAGTVFPTRSSYTIALWVKRTGSGSNNVLSGASGHVFYASSSSQQNHLAAGHNGNYTIVRDPDSLDLDVWYHTTLTFDYSTGVMILYRDGIEVDRGTASASEREMTDAALYVGAFAASSQWRGEMDDIRVYDRALSPEQVVAVYNGAPTVVAAETEVLDAWRADVTPFSGSEAGAMVSSNTLLIGYINQPPVLDTVMPQAVDVGDPLTFDVSSSEPDPQPLPVLTASPLPTGAVLTDHGDGTASFDWTPDYSQFGDFSVTIYATDDSLAVDSQEVVITVYPDTIAPTISLAYPGTGSLTLERHITLGFDIGDDNPMIARVWGGAGSVPSHLLAVDSNLSGGSREYFWQSPVLAGADPDVFGDWQFNDAGSGAGVDSSTFGNDVTIDGARWSADGLHGYALAFDGVDDYAWAPDATSLDVDPATGALTIEAWVYPDAAGDGVLHTIVSKRAFTRARTVNYELLLNFNRALMFGQGEGSTYIYLSDVTVPADQWSYVAVTVDAVSGVGRFYLNGVLADSVSAAIGPMHNEPLYIGAAGPDEQPFLGMIDEVRLTSRVLSPSEIDAAYRLSHGAYSWMVEAEDASGNAVQSEIRSFAVYNPVFVDPALTYPVESSSPVLYDLVPQFVWTEWIGPSPLDTTYYRLHVATKRDFSFEAVFDSIQAMQFQWVDSLQFGKQYWWQVDAWAETDSVLISTSSPVDSFWTWALGDLNADHGVNIADLTTLVQYLFAGGTIPAPPFVGDLDHSCSINVSDLTQLVAFLFQGGDAPSPGCE